MLRAAFVDGEVGSGHGRLRGGCREERGNEERGRFGGKREGREEWRVRPVDVQILRVPPCAIGTFHESSVDLHCVAVTAAFAM